MATKEIVVNLRLTDGDAVSRLRGVKGALIDVKEEVRENNKALRDNIAAIKAVEKAQKEGKVTTEQAAVSLQLLTNERERLKRTSADLSAAEAGLSAQQRELRNEVGGLTEAGLRFRDKMAEASLEALKQSGILGQLEARTQALKDEQEKANQEFKEGVITQQQYDDVLKRTSTELVTVEQKEKMLREEVDRLNREFKEGVIGVDQYKQELGRLGQAQQRATGSFSQFFGGINDGKSALTGLVSNYIGIGAAVYGAARAIGSAITTIKDFQQENANLASILGKTRAEIKALTDSAIEIGPALGRAPEEVTKLQTELAKLGFTETQILAAQQAVIQLANATGESLPKSAEVAAATLKGFDLQAEDTQRVVDVMAQSFNATSLDLEKFSVAMATLAPAAKAAGFSIEDTTALVGVLADRGLDASVVGTSLRSMFIDLSKSGMSLDDALETINNSTNKTKTAFELFGERAAGAAVILAENRQETDDLAVSLGKAGGAAQKMADEQLNTLTGATNRMSASWQAFVVSLESGDGPIAKTFTALIGFIADALGGLAQLGSSDDLLAEAIGVGKGSGQRLEKSLEAFEERLNKFRTDIGRFDGGVGEDEFVKYAQTRTRALLKGIDTIEEAQIVASKLNSQIQELDISDKSFAEKNLQLELVVKKLKELEAAEKTQSANAVTGLDDQADALGTVSAKREELKNKIEAEKEARDQLASTDTAGIAAANKTIAALEAQMAALDGTTKAAKKLKEVNAEGSVAALNAEISKLTESQAQSTNSAQFQTYQAQIDKLKKSVEEITALAAVGAIFDALAPADTVGQAGSTQEGPLPEDASRGQAAADQLAAEKEVEAEIELQAQQELIDIRNAAELDGKITLNEALSILDAEYKAGAIKTEEELAAKKAAITKAYVTTTAQQFANLFDVLSNLAQEGSAEQKALAIIGALINTYLGVTQALANLPPPASYVAAAVSLVSGLAAVKKISGFEEGGYTERARSNKKAVGVVHANEWVAPAHMVNDPNTGRVIDWLEYVRRGGFKRPQIPQQLMNNGFETGGFTSFSSSLPRPSISELLSASSTAELRAKEFTAQISVSEINNVQNRVAVTEQLSTA